MRMLARLTAAALITLTPALAGAAFAAAPEPTPAPLYVSPHALPGKYIVTLNKDADAAKLAERLKLKPSFVYRSAMNGFAVPLTEGQLDLVRVTAGVKSVEQDARVLAPPTPATPETLKAPSSTWGVDRIDQRQLPLDNTFTTNGNGAGVTAYILDTGIDYAHPEFGGRAVPGFDAIQDGRNGQDCQGHGTHVAGTVAGSTFGVARKANLVSVRVRVLGCDGSGAYSAMIAGINWVAKNAKHPAV